MRRHAFHAVALAATAAILSGCGTSGGYGFQTSGNARGISSIIFSNGSGQTNVFAVSPTGIAPGPGAPGPLVQVNAQGVSGSNNVVVPNASFTWTAAFTQSPATYTSNNLGAQKNCAFAVPTSGVTLPDISPFSSTPVLYYQAPGGGYAPLAPNQQSSTVFVTPAQGVTFASGSSNYCITVTAIGNGAQANLQVVVTNSP
jgi:hypothetical protein